MKFQTIELLAFLIGLIFSSCNTICPQNESASMKSDTVSVADLILKYDDRVLAKFTRNEYENIMSKDLPEIVNSPLVHPDTLYDAHAAHTLYYSSEQGHDVFCFLYSTYYSEKNHTKENLRNRILKLFHSVNTLYRHAFHYTSSPDHMSMRIPAYVEFEISKSMNMSGDSSNDGQSFNDLLKAIQPALVRVNADIRDQTIFDLKMVCHSKWSIDVALRFVHAHFSHFK
jgi:hypothetical protein